MSCDASNWINLAEDKDQWWAYVRAGMTSGFFKSKLIIQNFNSIDLLVSEILIFKLILIFKFQNLPYTLGLEVKH